jgi:hypothetical protein
MNVSSAEPSATLAAPDLAFVLGGPAYRIMQRVGIIKGTGPSVARRSACFILLTWVPLLVLAALDGNAIGPTPRSSLLLDFTTYARLFIAVPLVIAAEAVVGPRMRQAGLRFLQAGIVRAEDRPAFTALAARAQRRREAALPEIVFALAALLGSWIFLPEQVLLGSATPETWAMRDGHILSAGLWYRLIVLPLVQFVALRWLWRWVIWILFLWDVSRLRLNLRPTHTDMAAGIGFLGTAHVSMAIFPFAVGCIIAAEIAFRVHFEGLNLAGLQSMLPLLGAYLVFVELITFGPLLIFVSLLTQARLDALRTYGALVQQHNQLFHEKWIERGRSPEESPLGNADMSSLVDLGSSYSVIREMNVIPVSRHQLVQVAVLACLPGLPFVLLLLPVADVVQLLVRVLL